MSSYGGHSAQVRMRLLINGRSLRVVQLGPDFIFLEAPFDHPPCDASIVLQVDESERQWNVRLPQGISVSSERVEISAAE